MYRFGRLVKSELDVCVHQWRNAVQCSIAQNLRVPDNNRPTKGDHHISIMCFRPYCTLRLPTAIPATLLAIVANTTLDSFVYFRRGIATGGCVGWGTPLALEAVGKFLKFQLLSANLGLLLVSKTHQYSCLVCRKYHNFDSYWYFTTQNI